MVNTRSNEPSSHRQRRGAAGARSMPGTRRRAGSRAPLIDVHPGDVLRPEQLAEPAQVAADVAADLERDSRPRPLEPLDPERAPALGRGTVALRRSRRRTRPPRAARGASRFRPGSSARHDANIAAVTTPPQLRYCTRCVFPSSAATPPRCSTTKALHRLPRQRAEAARSTGRSRARSCARSSTSTAPGPVELRLHHPCLGRQGLALPDVRDHAGVRAAAAARHVSRQQLPARRPAQPAQPARALRLRPHLLQPERRRR